MQNSIKTIINEFLGEKMTVAKHKSGLSVYLVKKDFTASYAIFGTRYGSYDNVFSINGEKPEVPYGIAHFLEHKMFETDDGRDTFELFSEIGADANAYTSTDRTAYLFSCTENFYEALEILVKMVITPVFTDSNVQKEQGIIAQEIKMCEDRASDILHYNLMGAMYEKNPVRIPIAGTVESISKITPELLYKCYGAFYRMNNMALCICADAEIEEIMSILDKYIGEKDEEKVEFSVYEDTAKVYKSIAEDRAEIAKPLFGIGIKLDEKAAKNVPALDIICEAVFGESEDFFAECFEKNLVSSYNYYTEASRVCSYMEVGGDSDSPEEVLALLKDYAAKIRKNGLDVGAFERAKRKMYADVLQRFNDSASVAEELFESFIENENMLDCAENYAAVTYELANELAKEIFAEDSIALSVVRPKGDNCGE